MSTITLLTYKSSNRINVFFYPSQYDNNVYTIQYFVGKSQYGYWLSRKRLPVFIPDTQPPLTANITANHKVGIVTGGNESVPLSKTPQSNEIVIDHTKDKEDEIIALKNRIASIESWIKKVSESWVMNQQ
jgi:hypothetical protein